MRTDRTRRAFGIMPHIGLLRAVLLALLAILLPLPALSQTEVADEESDDGEVLPTDTLWADTLVVDTDTLLWPLNVQDRMDQLLQNDMFLTSQVGLMVWDLDADSAIYRYNERQRLRPASTMKTITAITALDRLGGSYQFKTELCYTGEIDSCTLTGNVYCVGGFDPRFNSDDMRAFAESLRKMGIDTIRGNLYADLSMKDSDRLGWGWCWDDDNPVLSPLLISGKDQFMQRFYEEVRKMGIYVTGSVGEATKPQQAHCIVMRFHTIDQILMRMLKQSDNLYAESMFYQLAASTRIRPASAKSALNVFRQLCKKIGMTSSGYQFADGSGLSLYNYVTAELEVAFLRYAYQNSNIYNHLLPALPIAGRDGTLKKRMTGEFTRDNVKAKTGTVEGVSSLCGYVTAANGHRLCFAIINQGLAHTVNGRRFQDRVCNALAAP